MDCDSSDIFLQQVIQLIILIGNSWTLVSMLIIDHPRFNLHKMDIWIHKWNLCSIKPMLRYMNGHCGLSSMQCRTRSSLRNQCRGHKKEIDASANKPFVYASTGSVRHWIVCTERIKANPISTYSVYKLGRNIWRLSAVILRPATALRL